MGKKRAADLQPEEDAGEEVQDAPIAAPLTDVKVRDVVAPRPFVAGDKYLKIISWNVNGLRSLVTTNKTVLLRLIANHKPDILCFQVYAHVLTLGCLDFSSANLHSFTLHRKPKSKTTPFTSTMT